MTRARSQTHFISPSVVFYAIGSDKVALRVEVPVGRGRKSVVVEVTARDVVEMADKLRPVLDEKDPGARSHALWHYSNPTSLYPCGLCRVPPTPPPAETSTAPARAEPKVARPRRDNARFARLEMDPPKE